MAFFNHGGEELPAKEPDLARRGGDAKGSGEKGGPTDIFRTLLMAASFAIFSASLRLGA